MFALSSSALKMYFYILGRARVLPAGTVAQRFGRDVLVVVLRLLSSPSCRGKAGASWTDVAVTLVAGIDGPAA